MSEYVKGEIYYGIKTGLNEAFVIDAETRERLIKEDPKSAELIKPFLLGRDVKRFNPPASEMNLILMPNGWTREHFGKGRNAWNWIKENYPAVANHLQQYADKAEKRFDKGEYWWELRACDYYDEFQKSKIIYPNICKKPEFTFDSNGLYTNQKCFIIPLQDKYLLAILNSSVTFFLFRSILPKLRGDFYEPSYIYFKEFPIRTIDFNIPSEKATHDKLVPLVDRMLDLHKKKNSLPPSAEREKIEREIAVTDEKIDEIVYGLYGVTEEERRTIEGK